MAPFAGFPDDLEKFLVELKRHNERPWFEKNKDRYLRSLKEPALAYVAAMQGPLEKLSPFVAADPRPVGGSLMRIYRDTRFSREKTPYKTNVGIQFRHVAGKDIHAPGFYVHLDPDGCFFGAGIWHPESAALRRIREAIASDPKTWVAARDSKPFRERYSLAGDSLSRPPQGFPADHPQIDDLKRKDFIGIAKFDFADARSPAFVKRTADAFKAAVKLMRFLCNAVGQPF
jgi:uncharacterized protein (TIGR02453 family)